jgi:cysteinyl-tRNA synthetase
MLRLYNSMSRKQEVFRPRNDNEVKIFTCGPSTYRRPHIGNYRTFLYEDILVRYLEYLGYEVKRVINFTDVEDKMLEEAIQRGKRPEEIASSVAERFFAEADLLGIKLPRDIPRASTSVEQAASLIQKLLDKGIAYWHDGNVFFDPLKFEGFGKLYRLDLSKWPKKKVRFKKDTYRGKRWNRGDFILWHGPNEQDVSCWDTVIGQGRPSWNIQDPAMVTKTLGYQIDINCGGIDNIFRHHDYNIAVIESISGKEYARYYLHGEHLMVEGKPMSKSRRNILYPDDVLKMGYEAHHLRFFLIYTHYRRKLNLTNSKLHKAAGHLAAIRGLIHELIEDTDGQAGDDPRAAELIDGIRGEFERSMDEDLSVGRAVDDVYARLQQIADCAAPLSKQSAARLSGQLARIDTVLKVLL